jgi:hypothetical protein
MVRFEKALMLSKALGDKVGGVKGRLKGLQGPARPLRGEGVAARQAEPSSGNGPPVWWGCYPMALAMPRLRLSTHPSPPPRPRRSRSGARCAAWQPRRACRCEGGSLARTRHSRARLNPLHHVLSGPWTPSSQRSIPPPPTSTPTPTHTHTPHLTPPHPQGQYRAAIKHLERVLEISREMKEFTGDADAVSHRAEV